MSKQYDLRSDTITRPSDGMRKAMHDAEVGDDVYGEDPTVNRLQDRAAEFTGKEASLFVPTGSMGNLIPIFLNCGRGNELIAHEKSHILHYEMTSVASIAGVLPVAVPGERGVFAPDRLEPLVRPDIYYMPRTRMIEIENTHNLAGGSCWTVEEINAVGTFARDRGLSVHLDGARLMNAAVALDVEPKIFCEHVDTVTFCFSKGLGAPIGSVLCGDTDFIAEARRTRKLLGGAMRQVGVIAAAAEYALANNIDRLAEDHRNASAIAHVLAECPWASIDPNNVETNIICFDTVGANAAEVTALLAEYGIHGKAAGINTIRFVTCLEIDRAETVEICAILSRIAF